MNVDDLNEVKGLVDWLTPARAAYISAVISQPIDPRKAFLRLPELWPKEPHQVFGLRAHPVGWRIGLSGYALAWRRPPESVIDPVGTTVVEVGEFDPLDYSDENQVILEYLRPWLLGFSSTARAHQRDVALDAIRVQPAMMYGAEITLDQFNCPQYLLIYEEDKVEEASAQICGKIMRGEAWDLPGYSPDPNLDNDDYEGQATQHVRRVGPARVLGNDVARTINGLLLVRRER